MDGALIINVHMARPGPDPSNNVACSSASQFIPQNPFLENILNKFIDEASADVVFEVSSERRADIGGPPANLAKTSPTTFHAHRFILRECSPVLAELCSKSEGDTTPISISRVKPDAFKHLLFYAYGGGVRADELEGNAKEIIDAGSGLST